MADSFANQDVPHAIVRRKLGLIPRVQREGLCVSRPRRHGLKLLASKGTLSITAFRAARYQTMRRPLTSKGQERNRGE